MKRIFSLFVLLVFAFSFQSVYSLETYVGVTILNLSDDPTASCAGAPGYGDQGRIRAISSVLPEYPIYYELSSASNGSMIWSGNSTDDVDYVVGETMYLPEPVDLTIGETYELFFDIDAIRVYLPLADHDIFNATPDNNYWIVGNEISLNEDQFVFISSEYGCSLGCGTGSCGSPDYITTLTSGDRLVPIFNSRNLDESCFDDGIASNCLNAAGYQTYNYFYGWTSDWNFNTNGRYNNLHNSSNGNFNLAFTFN